MMPKSPSLITILAAAFPLLAAACGPGVALPVPTPTPVGQLPPPEPISGVEPTAVGIPPAELCLETQYVRDRKVEPATITAKAPCRIMFTNRDDTPVQITGQGFQIGPLGKDESWVQGFRQPGTFTWADTNDPSISGTIIIQ